jgi:hypothetical protein
LPAARALSERRRTVNSEESIRPWRKSQRRKFSAPRSALSELHSPQHETRLR